MSLSLKHRVAQLTAAQRKRWFTKLPNPMKKSIVMGTAWWFEGRPEQQTPKGAWRWWLVLAGRGWGKTRVGAEWAAEKARRYPGARIALVAPTFADGRDTMVEGISGLLSVLHPSELRGGGAGSAWNRSMGELFLANGSRFKIYSSERPKRLRGPQHHFAWGDEPAYWEDVEAGTAKDSTFSNLNIGLRLPPIPGWERGYRPQGIFTTTPRRVPLLKMPDDLVKERPELAGLMQRKDVIITTGSTMDNIDNLDESYKESVIDPLIGTTLGVQELGGIMLEDVEGALWTTAQLAADRLDAGTTVARLDRVVVSFDPSGGGGYGHDEHGIMVIGSAGAKRDQRFYLLADRSGNCTPNEAAERAIFAYLEFGAAKIVYEKNQGQDWIPAVFRAVWEKLTTKDPKTGKVPMPEYEGQTAPSMEAVSAVKNKRERATPVAMLYQQHRVHHIGLFPILENQMTTWLPDEGLASPDRLDACFVAGTRVLTQAGERPIESVRPGDLVWTRAGWRPVLRAERTRIGSPVGSVLLSNGRALCGTPEHRVLTHTGWRALDTLVCDDNLVGWTHPPLRSSSTTSPTPATRTVNGGLTASTTPPHAAPNQAFSTAPYGPTTTGLSRQDCISTTLTSTRSTTTPETCKPSPRPSTPRFTQERTGRARSGWIIWPLSARWRRSGTAAMKATPGMWSTGLPPGLTGTSSKASALSAVPRPATKPPVVTPEGSAPADASNVRRTDRGGTPTRWTAQSAADHSIAASTATSPQRAPVHVVRSYVADGTADVYNLEVQGLPEYVAEGVIVHNCVWGVTWLRLKGSPAVDVASTAQRETRARQSGGRRGAASAARMPATYGGGRAR